MRSCSYLLILLSFLSSAHASTSTLNRQCWHEYPLSVVSFQSSIDGKLEYIRWPSSSSSPLFPKSTRSSNESWSYLPACTDVLPGIGSKLCVYTNTSFSNGRGISIFTTPKIAEEFAALPPFQDPAELTGINEFSGNWYTQEMPGKGIGMLAKRDLKFKDRVTAHTPALLAYLESDLSTAEREKFFRIAVTQLPQKTREMYLSLSTVYGIEAVKCQDVVKANTFQLEVGGHNHLAVFPETSRINHACAPNAQYYLDANRLTHFVQITRPVAQGEEITISYTPPLDPTHARQQHLSQGFHFTCTCPRCTASAQTDSTLSTIESMQNSLNDWSPSSPATPELAEKLLDIYRQEGLEGFMNMPYGFAALAYNAVGEMEKAVEYARMAEELVLMKDGEWAPSLGMLREIMGDPRGHWSFKRRVR